MFQKKQPRQRHGCPEHKRPAQKSEPQKKHYDPHPEAVVLVKEYSIHLFVLMQDEDEKASGPQACYAGAHRCEYESEIRERHIRDQCVNAVVTEQAETHPDIPVQVFQPQSYDRANEPGSGDHHIGQISRRDIDL